MGWLDSADVPLKITHVMKGNREHLRTTSVADTDSTDQTLPENLPQVLTLREIFSQYLDFNAVPRRPFFEYLRYFTDDAMEREKLTEFLSLEGEGAVGLSFRGLHAPSHMFISRKTSMNTVTKLEEPSGRFSQISGTLRYRRCTSLMPSLRCDYGSFR